ncbi:MULTISPECIES: alpha-E domain-containing protein [unclassified Saccharicrinis]|uniref:alpha-E domain-containing protein n=1 Tax=unclassified Saccharicrinis TaxID=2646859 RepID=UPI003D339C6C
MNVMLSRVAGNLYWMGRYVERAEHIARYVKELYFSSIDAPIEEMDSRKFVLESILYMVGIFDMDDCDEREVLYKIGFDKENSNSLFSIITLARENARGARNEISSEIWESINTHYHYFNTYPVENYLTAGLYDVMQKILEQTSVVRGKIYGSILHDETWSLISCAMHIERSLQMVRIINSKLHDVYKIKELGYPVTKLSFEWTTLLRCTESFDMNRKYYRSIPNKHEVLEFLMLNEHNPRSLQYSINRIAAYLSHISESKYIEEGSIEYKINKLNAQYNYFTIDEFKDDIYKLLNYTKETLFEISQDFEKKYLSY